VPRLLLAALTGLVTLALTAPAASAAPVEGPLSTSGARIVDARGRTVVLQGVNWFGFETSNHVVHGLWTRDHDDVLAQVRRLGFNTIRLPFSLQALRAGTISGVDFSGGRNAALQGKTPQQAMDVIVDAAARHGLAVILDCHSLADDGYQHGLWYGQGGFTEDDWVAAWRALAARYRNRPNVIGADLKNEPHGPATWGTGDATDWRRAAERAGNAVLAEAPSWLVLVEGIEGRVPGQQLDSHWWGGNLEGVRQAPVRLSRPGRVVYSPHEYGPGVHAQPWFGRPDTPQLLEDRWRKGFGYIAEHGIAPVLVGEFGGRQVGADSEEGRWQRQVVDFLGRTGASWTYWALNPNSGDTGGVLRDDWTSVDQPKMDLLAGLIARTGGAPAPAPGPTPTPTPTPSPAPAQVAGRVVVENRWADGWCGRLDITGPAGTALGGRSATFRLPSGTTVTQTWNGTFSAGAGRIRVGFPEWAKVPHASTGFCVSGTGTAGAVTVA
jgi:endoglucanase